MTATSGASHDFPTRLSQDGAFALRQPRLRAVVPRADGLRRGRRRAAEAARSRSSSAAPSTASTWSCRSARPTTTGRGRASRSRGPAPATTARSISTASSACNPRLQPLKPLWDARQLAIVHACGSPDTTRSHFDAQDYMESGTPGVKSTRGRLAEPLPAGAARSSDGDAVPRRRADAAAAAHAAGRRRRRSR